MPLPTVAERQKHVAILAASGERVARRMMDRLDAMPKGRVPTITMATDEYIEIGRHMTNLSGAAVEYHSLLAGGSATRDELIHLSEHLATACRALSEATQIAKAIVDRVTATDARVKDAVDETSSDEGTAR